MAKTNKEIITKMEEHLQLLWERYYRNNLKMQLESNVERAEKYAQRAERAGNEAESVGHAYYILLKNLEIKTKLDTAKIQIDAMYYIRKMYAEEFEELKKKNLTA